MIFKDILAELRKTNMLLGSWNESLKETRDLVRSTEKQAVAIKNDLDSIKDCGWRALKCVSQQGDTLQRMAESLAQLGEICATLKLTHDLDESLYMRAVKIHEQGGNHGEILQQVADDLAFLSDEANVIREILDVKYRVRPLGRAEAVETDAPEEAIEQQDKISAGLNNILNHSLQDHIDSFRSGRE